MSENSNINADATAQRPPAGWYPDPYNPAAQRYWDGAQWTELSTDPTPAPSPHPVDSSVAAPAATSAKRRFPKLKWWQWGLVVVGVLVVVSIIVNAVAGGRGSTDAGSPVSTSQPTDDSVTDPEPVDERQEVPGLIGLTVAEARTALDVAGFAPVIAEGTGDDWLVVAQSVGEGTKADAGAAVSITAEAPKPVYTLAQENAIGKAQSYLDLTGFSREGLIGQLEYEGFSKEDATFGADNAGADWNAEAVEKAQSYLELTSFSRKGLYDQLAYEKFTKKQIEHALAAVGF